MAYPKIAQLKSVEDFRRRLAELQLDLPVDDAPLSAAQGSPLAARWSMGGKLVANRWCIHPMEGWDAQTDGQPSELTLRRWRHFGESGAKLIWGGEAAAVLPEGRANARQVLAMEQNRQGLRELLQTLRQAHQACMGSTEGLLVGLQLTHSGRFSRPQSGGWQPRIAYHHPWLDAKCGIDPADSSVVCSDDELRALIPAYVRAAAVAADEGFDFVDVKACHGYLLHELLSARARPGPFGGDLAGRARLLLETIAAIRRQLPNVLVVVRLSVFDLPPYAADPQGQPQGVGRCVVPPGTAYGCGFGCPEQPPWRPDLEEPIILLRWLRDAGVAAVNLSCGSPYYNPHIQRPAIFPPSDGYLPPEDPLVGVARQIDVARQCKLAVPELPLVGTGYSYLQDYLPHVAQAVVRAGWIDAVGLGRMVLSYPHLPADTLAGQAMDRKRICRTFSDCTTAPRHGLVSGCFPLDPHYKQLDAAQELRQLKSKPSR